MALRGIAFQGATIAGPAIGGLMFAAQGGEVVYAVAAALFVAALVNVLRVTERTEERLPEALSREALFAGARFVRRTPVLFGAISLDLFAVLFGGAVALLPLFAASILDVGPFGLGILRSCARRRRPRRGHHPRPPPDPGQRRADAVHRRGGLRRVARSSSGCRSRSGSRARRSPSPGSPTCTA